jgi:hypothetical protein
MKLFQIIKNSYLHEVTRPSPDSGLAPDPADYTWEANCNAIGALIMPLVFLGVGIWLSVAAFNADPALELTFPVLLVLVLVNATFAGVGFIVGYRCTAMILGMSLLAFVSVLIISAIIGILAFVLYLIYQSVFT